MIKNDELQILYDSILDDYHYIYSKEYKKNKNIILYLINKKNKIKTKFNQEKVKEYQNKFFNFQDFYEYFLLKKNKEKIKKIIISNKNPIKEYELNAQEFHKIKKKLEEKILNMHSPCQYYPKYSQIYKKIPSFTLRNTKKIDFNNYIKIKNINNSFTNKSKSININKMDLVEEKIYKNIKNIKIKPIKIKNNFIKRNHSNNDIKNNNNSINKSLNNSPIKYSSSVNITKNNINKNNNIIINFKKMLGRNFCNNKKDNTFNNFYNINYSVILPNIKVKYFDYKQKVNLKKKNVNKNIHKYEQNLDYYMIN